MVRPAARTMLRSAAQTVVRPAAGARACEPRA
ncbi:hypothetical protein BJ987_002724 [Nocardia goodfellowii]|uniref:Uncharacterized protein n=1 Tax=Nocardia goodfellowii TaxID=882446 RepID=A0ABS4QE31_9NOCA|nr:hypothetical protein [Nocardia goodfellowii]